MKSFPFRPCLLLPALLLASCAATPATPPALAQNARVETKDNSTTVTARDYVAHIDANGLLDSLVVKGTETLAEPLDFKRDAKLETEKISPIDGGVRYALKGTNGTAQVDYVFRPDGLTLTPTWKGNGLYRLALTGSDALQAFELLTDKSPTVGEAVTFTDNGIVRGVPALPSPRNQMNRWHFANFALRVWAQRWGAPFNIEGIGAIDGRRWSSDQFRPNQPAPVWIQIEANKPATLAAVPFAPRTDKAMSLFYRDEPCVWNLDFGKSKATDYLRAAGVNSLSATWTLTDINGKAVGNGQSPISLAPNGDAVAVPVTIPTPGSGWYQVLFRLTDATGKMRTSEFQTRFTAINRVAGLPGRIDDAAGKPADDYAAVAMIGLGNVRESHPMKGYARNTAPAANDTNWTKIAAPVDVWLNFKYLDDAWNRGATRSRETGVGWFFQWNGKPDWATPEVFEAIAYAMVSRGKDRVRVWECENEPNGGYKPLDYLNKAVIPFWTGAKRADATAQIMGPNCVGVRQTLEFMDEIYKAGGGKYFDIISTHTYPGPGESWAQFGNLAMLDRLHQMMRDNGDAGKALWQTEQGYAWDANPKNQVARYATRQFLQGAREGIAPDHQYYFYPKAHGFQPWYQAGGGEEGSRDSWVPLAAAQHFAAENLVGTNFLKDEPSPYKGIYLARFGGATEDVIAAWTFDFATTLSASAPGLKRAVNWSGNEIKLVSANGRVALPLSGEPIYLHLAKGSAFDAGQNWGRDLARQDAGGVAKASSVAVPGSTNDSGAGQRKTTGASNANDGIWNGWEDALDLPGRTVWQAGEIATPANPQWLEIDFPVARTIDRILGLSYLPAVNATPRDWQIQVWQAGAWKTVEAQTDFRGWNLYAQFAPVQTEKIRLLLTGVNDGMQLDHRWTAINRGPNASSYIGEKVLISELEAYGPQTPLRVGAQLTGNDLAVTVSNSAAKAFAGVLRPQLPPGYAAQPASAPVVLAASDKTKTVNFRVVAPPEQLIGSFPLSAVLRDNAGQVVDAGGANMEVDSPIDLDFRPAKDPIEDGSGFGRIILNVKNLAATPLQGTVEVAGPTLDKPLQLPFALDAGKNQDLSFRAPLLIPAGQSSTFDYTAKTAGLMLRKSQTFDVRSWNIVGPFPNDFDRTFGPENNGATPDVTKTVSLPDGETANWKRVYNDPSGQIALSGQFERDKDASAYAYAEFDSPVARPAILSMGSDDGIRVWLNGENVWNNNANRSAKAGDDNVAVNLVKGRNRVLLKINQTNGGWGFYFDVLDNETKKPLADLNYAVR